MGNSLRFFLPGKKADVADVGGEGFFETWDGFKKVEFEVELVESGGEFDNDPLFFTGEGNGGRTAIEGVHFAVDFDRLDQFAIQITFKGAVGEEGEADIFDHFIGLELSDKITAGGSVEGVEIAA